MRFLCSDMKNELERDCVVECCVAVIELNLSPIENILCILILLVKLQRRPTIDHGKLTAAEVNTPPGTQIMN